MEIFTQEKISGKAEKHILLITTKEARTLLEMIEIAQEANKRKKSFKSLLKILENHLCCF